MTGNHRDVKGGSVSKRTGQAAIAGSLDYQAIFNICGNGMAFTEFDSGKILDVNEAWIQATGLNREKAIGRTASELGLWPSQTERETCFAELRRKGRLIDFKARLMMKKVELPYLISAEVLKTDGEWYALWEFQDLSKQKRIHDELKKSEEQNKSLLASSEQSRRALLGILEDEKLSREALRESEQSLSLILNTVPNGITFVNREGQIVFANPAAERILALEKSGITERTYDDPTWKITSLDGSAFPVEDLPFAQIKKSLKPVSGVEHAIIQKDGKRTILSINAAPILGMNGRFDGMVTSITDITRNKLAEAELAKERYLLNSLIESIPDSVYFKDRESRFIRINRPMANRFGLDDPSQAFHKTDHDYFHQSHAREARGDEKRILSGDMPIINKEEKETWPDGHMTWVSTIKLPIKDEKGTIIGSMGISRDITENKKAEKALADSEAKFKSIYEGSKDAIMLLDKTGFLDCNPSALVMFGFKTKSEFIGLLPEDVSPPKQPDGINSPKAARNIIRKAFEKGRASFEWTLRKADGVDFPAEVLLSAFELNGKKVLQATVRDITERKRSEEALQKTERRFAAAFYQSNVVMTIAELDGGRFIDINDNFCACVGYSKSEILGKTAAELGIFGDASARKAMVEPAKKFNTAKNVEIDFYRRTGEKRRGLFSGNLIELEGKPYLLSTMVDITERKLAEETLSQKTALLEAQLNSSIDGILVVDGQGRKVLQNQRTVELWKIPKAIAENPDDQIQIDHVMNMTKNPDQFVSKIRYLYYHPNEISRDEIELKDGRVFDRYSAPVLGGDGQNHGRIWSFRDITERKIAEETIRQSEEKFRTLFMSMSEGFYISEVIYDDDGNPCDFRYLEVNPKFEQIAGVSRDQIIGKRYRELVPVDSTQWFDTYCRIARTGTPESYDFYSQEFNAYFGTYSYSLIKGQVIVFVMDISGRKRAEETLRASEERFRLMFQHSAAGMVLVAPSFRFIQANESFCKMLGYTEAELLEKTFQDVTLPEDRLIGGDLVRKVLSGEMESFHFEKRYLHKKGDVVWGLVSSTLIRDSQNKPLHFVTQIQDITERKKAEKTIRTLSSRNEAILSAIPDIIMQVNYDKVYTWANHAGFEFFGEDVLGHEAAFYFEGEQGTYDVVKPLFNGHQDVTYVESWQRKKNGEKRLLAWSCRMLKDDTGKVIGALSSAHDITERERAEEALRESEERFRKLFTASPDALILFDPSSTDVIWKIVDCNEVACSMNGYTREELIGSSVDIINAEVLSPEEHHAHVDKVRNKDYYQFETLHRHKDGHIFPIEVSTAIITLKGRDLVMGLDRDITERKRAEDALKKSEVRYRLLAENMSDVVFQSDLDARMEFVSPSVRDLLGYTQQEYLKMPLEKKFTAESYAYLIRNRKRGSNMLELQMLRKNGDPIWVESKTSPYHDEEGRLKGIIGVMRDISERKDAELRKARYLHEQEIMAKVSSTLVGMETSEAIHGFIGPVIQKESGADYVVIGELDRHTENVHVRYASGSKGFASKWIRLTGKNIKTLSIPVRNIEPESMKMFMTRSLDFIPDGIQTLLGNAAPKSLISKIERTFKINSTHMMSFVWGEGLYGGVILGFIKGNIVRNTQFIETLINEAAIVIQRRQAEEARRESEERFRSMILTANEGVWFLDTNLTTVMVNQKIADILGYTIDEMLGMTPVDFMPRDDNRTYLDQIRERKKGITGQYEQAFLRKDGELIWLLVSASPVLNEKGRFTGSFGMMTDITDRKRAEQDRERLIKELRGKNEELEAFTYTVSHDLKSPLVTVKGFLGILQKDIASKDPNAVATSIHYISDAVDKMENLLRDLLDLSRVGRMVQPMRSIPYAQLTNETAQMLAGIIRERGVKLSIKKSRAVLYGDPVRMKQLMMNLLTNAVKFMGDQPKPVIEVGVRKQPEGLVFFVKDNGIGIDPRFKDKIFGLFDKLDPQTDGTGVGLAIVKRIIQIHNGRMWVESEGEGKGSTFCFTLPKG